MYYTFVRQNMEVIYNVSAAKMGRPTDNPKECRISVRINAESKKTLDDYCKAKNASKTQAIERGIFLLKNDLK